MAPVGTAKIFGNLLTSLKICDILIPVFYKCKDIKHNNKKEWIIMKKMTLRRILSLMLALLMVLAALSLTACSKDKDDDKDKKEDKEEKLSAEQDAFAKSLGGVSETFKGAVSEKTYETSKAAAEAFVQEELVGEASANILNVTSKELDEKEIKKLDIPEDLLKGSDAVEEMEVKYSVDAAKDALDLGNGIVKLEAEEELNKSVTVKVYVIKFGVDWKYFTPMPVTGDTISKTYYDSVFNAERYKNCTLESTSDVKMVMTQNGEKQEMNMKTTQKIKHADGKIYLDQTIELNAGQETETQSLALYMETVDGKMVCYVKMAENADWVKGDLSAIGFTDIEQLTPFHDQYLDYTYFTKTNFGFELADDNAKSYFSKALGAALGMLGNLQLNEDTLKMHAEYYVSNGVLSGMDVNADVELSMTQGENTVEVKETVVNITKCTDYGKTVVEKPFTE